MKWYFASRTKHIEKIKQSTAFLESQNETVLSDWVNYGPLAPFDEHLGEVEKLNNEVVKAILDIDIFVLISDQEGTDMFIELGIALGRSISDGIKIYVVGPYAKRSVMLRHSSIIHVADITELFAKERIQLNGVALPNFHD